MPVVITLIITILLVYLSWTWHNLGNIENTKKVVTIIISTLVIMMITFIVFNLSKNGIPYNSKEEMESVRNVLVLLFTFINGLIVMPSVAKVLGKINEKQIDKDMAQKYFLRTFAIFIVVLFFECNYMKSIQLEIFKIYNSALQIK